MAQRQEYCIAFRQCAMPRHGERIHRVWSPRQADAIMAAKSIIDASYFGEEALITHIAVVGCKDDRVVFEYPKDAAKGLF